LIHAVLVRGVLVHSVLVHHGKAKVTQGTKQIYPQRLVKAEIGTCGVPAAWTLRFGGFGKSGGFLHSLAMRRGNHQQHRGQNYRRSQNRAQGDRFAQQQPS